MFFGSSSAFFALSCDLHCNVSLAVLRRELCECINDLRGSLFTDYCYVLLLD